jgi:hypothetical protein
MPAEATTLAPQRPKTIEKTAARTPAPVRSQPAADLRARVAAAFREMANGVDERTAYQQTRNWYRSGGIA